MYFASNITKRTTMDASKTEEKHDVSNDIQDEEDLPYGLSVDWIISVGRHERNIIDNYNKNKDNNKPTLFGLQAHTALSSSAGGSTSYAFQRDQVTTNSNAFLLSPRPIQVQRSPNTSASPISYPVLTTPLNNYNTNISPIQDNNNNVAYATNHLITSPSQKKSSQQQNNNNNNNNDILDTKNEEENDTDKETKNDKQDEQDEHEAMEKMSLRVQSLHFLFAEFDLDDDGSIDVGELLTLLDHVRERSCILHDNGKQEYTMEDFEMEEAQLVMNTLDVDQNGTVEEDEWTEWMTEGIDHPDIRERLLTKGTVLSNKLKLLLDAVERISNAWIEEEVIVKKRRSSWYVNENETEIETETENKQKEAEEKKEQEELESEQDAPIPIAAKQTDIETYAKLLHALLSEQKLDVASLQSFFDTPKNGLNESVMVEDKLMKTDLVSKAACQLDHEGHSMCALHFLCWHSCFEPEMLNVFLKQCGTAVLHVSLILLF